MSVTNAEQKFDILKNWLLQSGVETIDEQKLKRQIVGISKWQENHCNGAIEAVTGFGKTYSGLFAAYLITRANPNAIGKVIVPSRKLYRDWTAHAIKFNLPNLKAHIVNSYTKEEFWSNHWDCDYLICDEGHRYLGKESKYFSKVLEITKRKATLLLSATLDKEEKQRLNELGIKVVDVVTMLEAKRMGYVSNYVVYNFGVTLSEQEQEAYDKLDKLHNNMYGKFAFYPYRDMNWALAKACGIGKDKKAKVGETWRTGDGWRNWYATEMGWDGTKEHPWSPTNIGKYSAQWNYSMTQRKSMLYKSQKIIDVAAEIIKKFQIPTITFSEIVSTTEELHTKLGDISRVYHSSMKGDFTKIDETKYFSTPKPADTFAKNNNGKASYNEDLGKYEVNYEKLIKIGSDKIKVKTLDDFEENKFLALLTAKALDEGFNVEGIRMALVLSGTSKERQRIQRTGRAIRFVFGKTAIIIYMYIKNTKSQTWLETSQKTETNIKWIDSIDQIDMSLIN